MTARASTGRWAVRFRHLFGNAGRGASDRSGAVAVLAAIAALAVVPLLGAAFDLSSAWNVQSKMQEALDQAVFTGSQADPLTRNDLARRMFLANLSSLTAIIDPPSFITTPDGVMHGSATAKSQTLFLSAARVQTLTVQVSSKAQTNPDLVTASATASTVLAATSGVAADKLRWAPPALTKPITLLLGTGNTTNYLKADQDYILKLPAKKKVGYTYLIGGRNIEIIGGYITLPKTSDTSNGAPSRAIYIKDATGVVHVEGVLIDASGGGMSDGIDISAPLATVQVENVRVDGVYGYSNQFHADVVQPFGGVKDLRIDKLTGYTGYQGLTIDEDLGAIGAAELHRVNLVATGTQIWGSGNNGGYLIWMVHGNQCQPNFPVSFDNVYVKPRATLANGVWPPATTQTACPASVTANDAVATFPKLPASGYVTKGMPPLGDYVPAGVAGLSYQSPGYMG